MLTESENNEPSVEIISSSSVPSLSLETLDEIGRKLLNGKFYLSALEFHTELSEIGRELPRLRDFFSNPGNFESQALDPLISLSKYYSISN